jgi:hypothetical protein
MALRRSSKYLLVVVAMAIAAVMSAVPASASPSNGYDFGRHDGYGHHMHHCFRHFVHGHWVFRHGHRYWVPGHWVLFCRR